MAVHHHVTLVAVHLRCAAVVRERRALFAVVLDRCVRVPITALLLLAAVLRRGIVARVLHGMARIVSAPPLLLVLLCAAVLASVRFVARRGHCGSVGGGCALLIAPLVHAFSPQPQLGFECVPSVLARLIVEVLTDDTLTAIKRVC